MAILSSLKDQNNLIQVAGGTRPSFTARWPVNRAPLAFYSRHMHLSPLGSSSMLLPTFEMYTEMTKSIVTLALAAFVFYLYRVADKNKWLDWIPSSKRTFSDLFFGYGIAIAVMALQLVR